MLILRTSGKRTLAKLNAFDFIVTVALGRAEVKSALRGCGVAEPEGAAAVILETDGSLSVVKA